ncbi:MAG: LysR substrate-binding domain-containing protein [Spongiibacteraceae bacterium]
METELLKTFLEIEKTRHFGRAADNLYLTQAAVSSRIRQLESTLGVSLFNRHRNNINLTPEGERLKPHAEAVINAWNQALQQSSSSNEQSLHIAIGGTVNLAEPFLQDYLHRIYSHYPDITLRAPVLERASLTQQLLKHSLDMAIIFDRPKVEELSIERIDTVTLVLTSTQQHTQLADINKHPYIQIDWGNSFNTQLIKQLPTLPTPALCTSTGRSALEFLLKHGGSAYIPEIIAAPYLDSGRLYLLEDAPCFNREVYAAYLSNNENKQTIENIITLLGSAQCNPNSTKTPDASQPKIG